MDTQAIHTIGVILAGGRGQRMGCCEKGLLPFRGTTLLDHAIERLTPQVDRLIINANRDLGAYRAFGLDVVSDRDPTITQGPMAGIEAAMAYTLRHYPNHPSWVLIAPCDSPFLPLDLANRLREAAIESGHSAAVAWDGVRIHPTFSLLHTRLQPSLTQALIRGELKLGQWLQDIPAAWADFSDQADAFINFNTPEQLRGGDDQHGQ